MHAGTAGPSNDGGGHLYFEAAAAITILVLFGQVLTARIPSLTRLWRPPGSAVWRLCRSMALNRLPAVESAGQ